MMDSWIYWRLALGKVWLFARTEETTHLAGSICIARRIIVPARRCGWITTVMGESNSRLGHPIVTRKESIPSDTSEPSLDGNGCRLCLRTTDLRQFGVT